MHWRPSSSPLQPPRISRSVWDCVRETMWRGEAVQCSARRHIRRAGPPGRADQYEKGPQSDRSAHNNSQIIRNTSLNLPHPVTTPKSQEPTTNPSVRDPSAGQEPGTRSKSWFVPQTSHPVHHRASSSQRETERTAPMTKKRWSLDYVFPRSSPGTSVCGLVSGYHWRVPEGERKVPLKV